MPRGRLSRLSRCVLRQTFGNARPFNAWRKQAAGVVAGVFSVKTEPAESAREGEVEMLHSMIGQFERDFLRKASGRSR